MSDNNAILKETRKTQRLLQQIHQMAHEASLTGGLEGGQRIAVRQYNAILQRLEQIDAVPPGYFQPLPEDATFAELGVSAALLASYIEEEEPATGGTGASTNTEDSTIIHGPVINVGGLKDLRDIGSLIRENLPEWLKHGEAKPEPPAAPAPPPHPEHPAHPAAHTAPPPPPPAVLPSMDAHPTQFVPDTPSTQQNR